MKDIYMIGSTHFDPVWLWKWDEAMASIHSTFRSALDRMKEDKDFIYSFATPPVFEWIKQIDPDMFEEIKQRVQEGRWELCEGWWLQPDCFGASGESYVRQSLYGQRYLKENFGVYSDTVFNVDSFGHNSAIPQILKKSHIDYYCICRPESKHIKLESPYFKWVGNDGSSVMAFRTGEYSEIYNKDMRATVEKTEENMKDATCDEMMLYGVTNHGGAPTKKAIADIHELNDEKDYNLKFSTISNYFKSQSEPTAIYTGEFITGDFGPYTNNHLIKKRNRIAEYSVLNAEKASVLAKKLLNKAYPKEELYSCWKDVMFNQFHDILDGASIKEAYFDAYNQQGRAISTANEITHYALQRITRKIKMVGSNPENPWNIVVWNLNDTEYDGYIEAEVQWLHEFPAYSDGIALEDADGNRYDCQVILEKSVIKGFRTRFLFEAKIPAFGYNTFKVIKTDIEQKMVENPKFDIISTDNLEIAIKDGLLRSITRKDTGKTYEEFLTPVVFEDEGDTWCFNVDCYGKQLENPQLKAIRVTESGKLRTVVKSEFSFRNSLITIYYIFYQNKNYFDIKYSVNWNEKHAVLKLAINTGLENIVSSTPFSAENREDSLFDVPMSEWLTLSNANDAVSVFANSLFSYSKNNNLLYLSILRSSICGDLRLAPLNDYDYPISEQGICEGDLRFVLHNDIYEEKIPQGAIAFNNPVIVICEANHDGIFSPTHSDILLDSDSVIISAIKECEDDNDTIVRLYESLGKQTTAKLTFFGNNIELNFKPFEIKTIKITNDKYFEVCITEDK